jgi:hypothetical protein
MGVPAAVGHGGRGAANGRLTCQVEPTVVGTAAASPLYKGATAGATAPPSLAFSTKSSAFNPLEHF